MSARIAPEFKKAISLCAASFIKLVSKLPIEDSWLYIRINGSVATPMTSDSSGYIFLLSLISFDVF